MKKSYEAPKLSRYGSIEGLTQQNGRRTKTIGKDDGVILIIDGLTPPDGVAIGSI